MSLSYDILYNVLILSTLVNICNIIETVLMLFCVMSEVKLGLDRILSPEST